MERSSFPAWQGTGLFVECSSFFAWSGCVFWHGSGRGREKILVGFLVGDFYFVMIIILLCLIDSIYFPMANRLLDRSV